MATPHSVYLTPLAWNDLLGLLLSARIYVTVAPFWLNLANPFAGSSPFFARSCHEDEASVYRPAPVERHAPIAGIYDALATTTSARDAATCATSTTTTTSALHSDLVLRTPGHRSRGVAPIIMQEWSHAYIVLRVRRIEPRASRNHANTPFPYTYTCLESRHNIKNILTRVRRDTSHLTY